MLTDTLVRRAVTEHTFTTFDGTPLFYRAWLPAGPAARALLLFHRGHEHSARWREFVTHLNPGDTAIFAWDQRGHGRSPGTRGSAPSLSAVIKDADWWARHIERGAHGIAVQDMAIVASSVGAVIAAAWVHDFAPPIRGMVLAASALRVKLYAPLALPALRLKEKLLPGGFVKSYVKSRMLTHDAQQAAAYDEDPAIFRQIAINMLLDLHDAGTRLLADAGAIQTPTLLVAAGKDWVVELAAQKQFFERLGAPLKQLQVYPKAYHDLFHESERAAVFRRVESFLDLCFGDAPERAETFTHDGDGIHISRTLRDSWGPQRPPTQLAGALVRAHPNHAPHSHNGHTNGDANGQQLRPGAGAPKRELPALDPLLGADEGGYTRTQYDLLRTPESMRWPLTRAALKALAPFSRGVRLGFQSGFDSGLTLDYIYQNRAQGVTPLGKFIDRIFLNAIGWRGIRLRRENLQRLLHVAIEHQRRCGERVHILDIAAGPGRYILEALAALRDPFISAHLCDNQQVNIDAAMRLAAELKLNTVTIARGDAFDPDALAALKPRPTIAVASGLFELFPQNAPVRSALAGLAAAMDEGGLLLYTNQPWHPQLEFIARALPNREGEPWIMRRRTQAEMDALARAAGFEKVEQEIDAWGIFTVSLARRL